MNKLDNEEFLLYLSRVRPLYHRLFHIAHAITDNAVQAEYALQYALLDCWQLGENSHRGLRDALKRSIVRISIKNASPGASDWDGLRTTADDPEPVRRLISQESPEMRRILALKYGCELSIGQIARLTSLDRARVRQLLERFEARTRRKLKHSERRRYDFLIHNSIRSFFAEPDAFAPEMNGVFRSFQADAAEVAKPGKLPKRIIKWIFAALLAILCILAFWLTAVLIQPPVLEDPVQTEIAESL